MLQAVPGLQVNDLGQAEILRAPVGSTKSVDDVIEEKIRLLWLMGERLCLLQSQDALLLLPHSCSPIHTLLCLLMPQRLWWFTPRHSQWYHQCAFVAGANLVAGHTTCECWRNWNQKHCSAGSVCLLGLSCRLHHTGSPDLPAYKTLPTLA